MHMTDDQQTVFLFSGQGSQYRHMGKVLYQKNKIFRQSMQELGQVADSLIGQSILDELYSSSKAKGEAFEETVITHPAIFMFEVSLARALIDAGIKPTAVIGVSLGEFAAAVIAGIISAKQMLSVVIKSAVIINDVCQSGGMLLVLGNKELYDDSLEPLGLSLAGIYSDNNFVVSGSNEQLQLAQQAMKTENIVTARLPVTHAFHSDELDKCARQLKVSGASIQFAMAQIPFYSCETASKITHLSADHFINVACNPIRFSDTIHHYFDQNKKHHSTFIDIAPSGSLSTLTKDLLDADNNADFKTIFSPYSDQIIDYKEALLKDEFMVNTKKMACIFPGQGAQVKGMGEHLFLKYPDYVEKANRILGWSVDAVCLNDPDGCLKQTQYTQPCLFVVNALAYLDHIETKPQPDFVMGHSLGEYNALFAAGVISFEQGVKLVKKRAELMSQTSDGGMAAVIGLRDKEIEAVLKNNGFSQCYIANKNTPSQTIISGDLAQIQEAKTVFLNAGSKAYIPLQVSGAFHSHFMQQAAIDFAAHLKQVNYKRSDIPVISNVTAKPHGSHIAALLQQQITQPVDWLNSVRYLLEQGVEEFIELSDKKVVTKMVKEITLHWSNNQKKSIQLESTIEQHNHQPPQTRSQGTDSQNKTAKLKDIKKQQPISTRIGNPAFLTDHRVQLPYVCGGMVHGIASPQMVVRCAQSGILSFLGTGALRPQRVEESILHIKKHLTNGESFGVNLLSGSRESDNVALFLKHNITRIEAAAYIIPSEPLIMYRLRGLGVQDGQTIIKHKVLAKLSRPEVAALFLAPAAANVVEKLLSEGKITPQQAELSKHVPLADDICVEADSGGHTDQGVTAVLLPAIIQLRDEAMQTYGYQKSIRIGSGGGIGTPSSAASAFILGADFILTGSINQCTVEAGTSDVVKSMLQDMRVQDTAYAPAGDMFELGARVQVLKRGVFFPARANRLFDLYTHHESLDEIDKATIDLLEKEYFKKSIAEVWDECREYRSQKDYERAMASPKLYMAYVFKWYFAMSNRLALAGKQERKVDFQIHTGPALGAFNQWVKGTDLEKWQARHVDDIAYKLMKETEILLYKAAKQYQ